jgi:hypothetical protein
MPKKRPPNAEATQFRSGEEAAENGRKGGVNSGIARREKKTIQNILNNFLSTAAKDSQQLSNLAKKMGLEEHGSIKELFAMVCVLNTMKNGDLSDLERLAKLLGEQATPQADEERQEDALSKALREEAERMNKNADQ